MANKYAIIVDRASKTATLTAYDGEYDGGLTFDQARDIIKNSIQRQIWDLKYRLSELIHLSKEDISGKKIKDFVFPYYSTE